MNAFATAMNIIFTDANMAVDALWLVGGTGPGVAIRVIPDLDVTGMIPARIGTLIPASSQRSRKS